MTKDKRGGLDTPAIDDISTDSLGSKHTPTPGVRYHISVVVKEIRDAVEKRSSYDPTLPKAQSQRDIVRIELGEDVLSTAITKAHAYLDITVPQ